MSLYYHSVIAPFRFWLFARVPYRGPRQSLVSRNAAIPPSPYFRVVARPCTCRRMCHSTRSTLHLSQREAANVLRRCHRRGPDTNSGLSLCPSLPFLKHHRHHRGAPVDCEGEPCCMWWHECPSPTLGVRKNLQAWPAIIR